MGVSGEVAAQRAAEKRSAALRRLAAPPSPRSGGCLCDCRRRREKLSRQEEGLRRARRARQRGRDQAAVPFQNVLEPGPRLWPLRPKAPQHPLELELSSVLATVKTPLRVARTRRNPPHLPVSGEKESKECQKGPCHVQFAKP